MSLHVDIGWLVATMLVSVRVACATLIAPVFGPTQIPTPARVALGLALSAFMVSALPVGQTPPLNLAGLLIAICGEAVIGLSFAFGFIAAYGATQLAGRALDVQIGFGAAGVLNPATQIMSPLIGSVLGMVAIAAFLSLDGHLVLMKALAMSVTTAPPGSIDSFGEPELLLRQSAVTFTFALALAGPIMLTFLLSDLAMAIFARSMPQLNVFVLGFAVKIVIGLIGLAFSLRFADAVLSDLFGTAFGFWDRLATGRD